MPKLKTHKGAAKRFRVTASGKIKRGHSHARHILTEKTSKRKRLLDIDALVADGAQKRVQRRLPYGRDRQDLSCQILDLRLIDMVPSAARSLGPESKIP